MNFCFNILETVTCIICEQSVACTADKHTCVRIKLVQDVQSRSNWMFFDYPFGFYDQCVNRSVYLKHNKRFGRNNYYNYIFFTDCQDDEKCRGPNEEYLTCGTACQPTCMNYMEKIVCNKPCVKGCFCKPGYVRNAKFRCVLPEHCFMIGQFDMIASNWCNVFLLTRCRSSDDPPKPRCHGYNEEFNDCGTACPDTCANYMIQHNCARQCKKGCFCKAGYVRDEDGFCVLPKDCPPAGIKCK